MAGIKIDQLIKYVIHPALLKIECWSQAAENLIIGTCLQESLGGFYLHQISGPALGIYQMEPATHDDLWSWLELNSSFYMKVFKALDMKLHETAPPSYRLIYDLDYATIMCRVKYLSINAELPAADDDVGLANFYKNYYNSVNGKASVADYLTHWRAYKRGLI